MADCRSSSWASSFFDVFLRNPCSVCWWCRWCVLFSSALWCLRVVGSVKVRNNIDTLFLTGQIYVTYLTVQFRVRGGDFQVEIKPKVIQFDLILYICYQFRILRNFYLGKLYKDLRVQFNAKQPSTTKFSLFRNIYLYQLSTCIYISRNDFKWLEHIALTPTSFHGPLIF